LNNPAALLQNETAASTGWIGAALVGSQSNRGGVGAVVRFDLPDRTLVRLAHAGSSYLSCDEEALLVALPGEAIETRVTVAWPSGRKEAWPAVGRNRFHRLIEGSGQELTAP
jgi:hypothetical protein